MRVAIITFNRAINYGAVLQSLALKKTVESFGHECEIVNYKCDLIEQETSPFYINSFSIKDILVFLFQIKMRISKNKKFFEFSNQYLDTKGEILDASNIRDLAGDYDLYITGSDQVWNYEITGLDENYFLAFAPDKSRRASYAASFGVAEIPDNMKVRYKELLDKIDIISVREEEGQKIVKGLTGRDAVRCVDPVFLIDKNQWLKYAVKPKNVSDYILVYGINKTGSYKIAEKISQRVNCPIVGLQTPMSNRTRCKKIRTESPTEFLGWFCNARYIITDSFHGTAFSIIFEKQFVVCTGGDATKRLSRQRTLLNTLELDDRICTMEDCEKIFDEIDYNKVKDLMEKSKNESMKYLNRLLEGE